MTKKHFAVHLSLFTLSVLVFADSGSAGQKQQKLLDVLKAHAGSVQTFQADVQITRSPGRDRVRLAQATRQDVAWTRRHRPDFPAQQLAEMEKYAQRLETIVPSTTVTFYRYYAKAPGLIRVEEFGERLGKKEEPILLVYTGDRWQDYLPVSRAKGVAQNQMGMFSRYTTQCPPLEVARAQAVPVNNTLLHVFKLSAQAKATLQVSWGEFLPLFSPEMAREVTEPLSGGGRALPVLELSSPSWENTGLGAYRLRVWFDPLRGYVPVRMECHDLDPDRETGKHSYLLSNALEWSEPIELPNGMTFAGRCKRPIYHHFRLPVEVKTPAGVKTTWPGKPYEMEVHEIKFSNVRVNEPLDAGLFKITPPTGTNVVDEVSGYRYLVGSAGEELGKSALALRDSKGNIIEKPAVSFWRTAWPYVVGVFIIAALAAILYRRTRKDSKPGKVV